MVFTIFKNILFICNQTVLEMLVADEFYLITFGALECKLYYYRIDDMESVHSKIFVKHREFLTNKANFKNIFSIDDQTVIEKIQMNYRLSYMRDIAIARFVEETTVKNMNIIIHYNNSDIIQYITCEKTILKSLFEMINSDKFNTKYEGLSFLIELNQICRELMQTKIIFYETLCELNFLEVMENLLTYLSSGRKSKYVKNKPLNLNHNNNHHTEEIPGEQLKKRELMEINMIEILICCLNVVPSNNIFNPKIW
jgi:hypothetical protein